MSKFKVGDILVPIVPMSKSVNMVNILTVMVESSNVYTVSVYILTGYAIVGSSRHVRGNFTAGHDCFKLLGEFQDDYEIY